MKLILQDNRIIATATDEYEGTNAILAPEGFDPLRISEYIVTNGVISFATPDSITMRQARLALNAAGLLTTVSAAVAAADEATKIEWEYAATLDRNWPTLAALATTLGMTEEQVDNLFLAASVL